MLNRLIRLYHKLHDTPEQYARWIGVTIGKNCLIGSEINWPSEPYLITIGNNVQLTPRVSIHTHGGGQTLRSMQPDFDAFGKVVIEDWAYIGSGAQIMPGVTIGEGALVAAGSIVTKSVAPHSVVGGNPAHFICTTDEFAQRNLKYNTHTKGLSNKEKRGFLLKLPDHMFVKK